jgi:hypothetical protein
MYCKVQCFPYICAGNKYSDGETYSNLKFNLSDQPNWVINLFEE